MHDGVMRIREWLADHPSQTHRIRQEAFFMSYSAVFHRCMTFGMEPFFEQYTGHELLEIIRLFGGQPAVTITTAAFARALAEEDHDVATVIAESRLAASFVAWANDVVSWPEDDCVGRIAAISEGEERQMARLLVARRFPALARLDWLVADGAIPLQAALTRCLATRRPDLHSGLLAFLRAQPAVLYHQDPDLILAPIVAASAHPPQTLLDQFEGTYGEATVVAAAEWHLEHDQPAAAGELARQIRLLSVHRDRALAVLALAALEQGQDPTPWTRQLIDAGRLDDIHLRRMELQVGNVAKDELVAILDRCTSANPERFYRGMLLLLKLRDLASARRLCRDKATLYEGHPALTEIIATVLRGAATA